VLRSIISEPGALATLIDHRPVSLTRRAFLRGSATVAGSLALTSLLAACGGDDDDDDPAAAATSAPAASTATSAPAATATFPSGTQAAATSAATTAATPAPAATATTAVTPEPVSQGTPGGELVIAFAADPQALDPHRTSAQFAQRILALMHDELACRDYDGAYVPNLATEWEVSDDGLTYTFTIREGVTFHSGKAMTAADFQYSFERWKTLEGSPTAFAISPVETIDAPDDVTLVLNLSQPFNILFDSLTNGWAVVLNQEVVEAAGDNYGVDIIDGTGPFVFDSWTRSQGIKMQRFDAYTWGSPMFENPGPAYVDAVEFRVIPEGNTRIAEFEAGNIHLLPDVPVVEFERLSNADGVEIVTYPQWHTTYFGMNVTRPPCSDIAVRRAISYAIDRQVILDGAFFSVGALARTVIHPDCPNFWEGSFDIAPSYDPEMAAQILDEAGWAVGDDGVREKDGVKLVIPLWIINGQISILSAQIVQELFAPIGMQVEVQQFEETAWFEAVRTGDQTTWMVGGFHTTADFLYSYFHTKGQPAPNRFRYSVPEVDAWLEDARTNQDDAVVTDDYKNVQERIIVDAPHVPLVHQLGTTGRTDKVQGAQFQPTRWLYRMQDVWLEQ
jgi:peptide/nickel transport system substrate-binding protein